jgi:RNA polymerase sigma-70 factor, ECF subfamily
MRDLTLSEVERLEAASETDVTFEMEEDAFRAFYDRTARSLWGYLSRLTGDPHLADDLLQESYYRFLRSPGGWENERHRRAYLFRIATNLVRDGRRRSRHAPTFAHPDLETTVVASTVDLAETTARRADLQRAFSRLRPRERAMLWLAYAQGQAHTEIAGVLGVKTGSVKLLLFRARRKLAGLLRPSMNSGRPEFVEGRGVSTRADQRGCHAKHEGR